MDKIYSIGNISGGKTQSRTVYLTDGICPTLTAGMTYGNTVPYIIVEDKMNNNDETPNRIGNLYGEDRGTSFAGNVWDDEAISPTLTTMAGGGRQPHIIIDDLYSNREERFYKDYSPALRSERSGLKVVEENIKTPDVLGGLGEKKSNGGTQYFQQDRVYDSNGIAMCHPASIPGGSYRYLIDEDEMNKEITQCAMRGRYNENGDTEQQLELREDDVSKCLTTVTKDNLIMEEDKIKISQATKKGYIEMNNGGVADLSFPNSKKRRGRVQGDGEISPALMTGSSALYKIDRDMTREELIDRYKIRKLTPLECWRIMNYSDDDFKAAEEVNSNTHLYGQAGNAIVENCLVAIFGQMFEGKENVYKQINE